LNGAQAAIDSHAIQSEGQIERDVIASVYLCRSQACKTHSKPPTLSHPHRAEIHSCLVGCG